MNSRSSFATTLLGALLSVHGDTVNFSDEPCQDLTSVDREEAPWKVRLYGANKDRRAARKKRTKKLGRRR